MDKKLVEQILSEIDGTEERERRQQNFQAFQVYSGNLRPYVEQELQRTRPDSWKYYTISNVSVSRMVTNKLSKAYSLPPKRSVGSDAKNDRLDEIYQEADANRQFQEFDINFNRDKHCLYWVNWLNSEQKYHFMALAGYEWSIFRDKDSGKLEMVVLNYPDTTITSGAANRAAGSFADGLPQFISESQIDSAASDKVYAIWTKDQHVAVVERTSNVVTPQGKQIKKSIDYLDIPGNPNNENPLGIIPFVYLSKDTSVDFPTTNPLTEQTITFNALWSELLTAANLQGTSIMTLSYDAKLSGKMDTLQGSMTSVVELIQPSDPDAKATEANFISPSPDLSGQKETYLNYLRMVLAEHGITSSQGLDGSMETFNSGLERLIAQSDQQQIINQNQMLFSELEKNCFEIVKAIEREVLNSTTFSESDELTVIYPKPKVMISDKETLENIKLRIDLGLIEKFEALMILDPNMSENEAKEKLDRIAEENMQGMQRFISGDFESDESSDESSESE